MIRCILGAALLVLASAAAARTLIINANGYDIGSDGRVQHFTGLFIDDDGKVIATLDRRSKEPRLEKGDYRLDAGGRTLLPGLIDSHMHLLPFGLWLRELDLNSVRTPAAIADALRRHARANASRRWLNAHGWHPDPQNPPTAGELDAILSDRPVWIRSADGQTGWANSAAIAASGVNASTQAPRGGQILRDAEGQPSGIFRGTAMALVAKHQPAPSAGERELALAAALKRLPELGVTGVHDMGVTAADWALYRSFGDRDALPLRITAYADGVSAMEAISPLRPTARLYAERLQLHGILFAADGGFADYSAWLPQPYADAPDMQGAQLLDDAKAKNLLSRANFLGFQAAVHATGDAAIAQMLDSFAEITPAYGHGFRNRIEHAALIAAADVERFAQLHITASLQPVQTPARQQILHARLGSERFAEMASPAALGQAGISVVLGTNAPQQSANPFAAIHAAVSDATTTAPAQAVGKMLAGFTINAAAAAGADKRLGRLAPGYWADFILLDRDPFAIPPDQLQDVQVEEGWLAGQRIFQRQPQRSEAASEMEN